MSIYVPDASIILAFLLNETENGTKAERFFAEVQRGEREIVLPSIWFYEVANKLGRLNSVEASKYRALLGFYKEHFFVTVELDQEITDIAFSLMKKYQGVTFYDASYHALAIYNKGIFLTLDKKYFEIVEKEGNIEIF